MIKRVFQTAIEQSVFRSRQPKHLILHVTSACNSRCGMCFAWQRLNKDKDLTLEEIKKIASLLPKLTFLDISGGEPFLRDDLAEILAIFEKESPGAYVNVPTNGLIPDKIAKETQKILQKTKLPISLNLSLDGLKATHEKIRGIKGNFAKVQETYEKLNRLKEKNPRLSLKIVTVISRQNFHELTALTDFVRTKMTGIDFQALTFVRGQPRDQRFVLPSLPEIAKKRAIFFRTWQHYGYGKNLGGFGQRVANVAHRYLFNLYLKTLREKKMALPCLAGQAHAVIYANGDLALCELHKPIGNLRKADYDFERLWRSQAAEKQRQEIKKGTCFCTHGCVWTDNLFFNLRNYPALIWELSKSFARIVLK